jgi:diguanylate cyclase (GGDEF)-like protein
MTPETTVAPSAAPAEQPGSGASGAERLVEMHRLVRRARATLSAAVGRDEVDDALTFALGLVGEHADADRAYIFRYRHGLQCLDNTHEWCAHGVTPELENLQDLDASMVHDWTNCFLAGEALQVQDVADYPEDRAELRKILMDQGIVSVVVQPLLAGGHLIGFVGFDLLRSSTQFSADHLEVLATLSDAIALALSRQDYADRLDRSEKYDHLTGLLRRRPFTAMAAERGATFSGSRTATLCVLDIDGFGELNDRFGQDVGDQVLRVIAERASRRCDGDDLIARLGGDSFALLTGRPATPTEAAELVTQLAFECARPITTISGEVRVTVSAGLAMTSAAAEAPHELLRRSEAALREAKSQRVRRGAGTVVAFEPELEHRVNERMALTDALCSPTASAGLWTMYQPFVDLVSRKVLGAEALARWDHPMTGPVPPDVVVPLAEQLGIIDVLTTTIAGRALDDLSRRFQPAAGGDFVISVNLSTYHLSSPAFLDSCARTLAGSGVRPSSVWLEVTESAELVDEPRITENLAVLRSKGFRVAIDDFGTGYSSFARLRDLPVDGLKIDRSFVADLDTDPVAQALVAAQVDVARSLGLQVIAEGIETDEEIAALLQLGVRYGQGFGLYRPMSASSLEQLLRAARPGLPRRRPA